MSVWSNGKTRSCNLLDTGSIPVTDSFDILFLLLINKVRRRNSMPRPQKKYHYIYKTTCKITGKFYVGMHSTDNLDDGYLGSGKILGYSRRKYGDENHVREIIEMLPSREALKAREKEIVNEELLADPLNINLKYGGDGGWDHVIESRSNLTSARFLEYKSSGRLRRNAISNLRKRSKQSFSDGSKRAWVVHRDVLLAASMVGINKMNSKAANEKRKQTFADRGHSVGERNSQFGTCWVTNGTPIKIKKEQLNEYLANGYSRGRKYKGE
jgi:hypothetical protein